MKALKFICCFYFLYFILPVQVQIHMILKNHTNADIIWPIVDNDVWASENSLLYYWWNISKLWDYYAAIVLSVLTAYTRMCTAGTSYKQIFKKYVIDDVVMFHLTFLEGDFSVPLSCPTQQVFQEGELCGFSVTRHAALLFSFSFQGEKKRESGKGKFASTERYGCRGREWERSTMFQVKLSWRL